jgi:hypothetical protein
LESRRDVQTGRALLSRTAPSNFSRSKSPTHSTPHDTGRPSKPINDDNPPASNLRLSVQLLPCPSR